MQIPTLLSLPAELRDIIYSNVLLTDDLINLPINSGHGTDFKDANKAVESFRSFSRSCRQIHFEIADIFFKSNTFTFAANATFSSIPAIYVRKMRAMVLYRTLMGKTFQLSIQAQQDGDVVTSAQVLESEEPTSKSNSSRMSERLGERMSSRFMKGSEVAATMLRPVVAEEGGLSLAILRDIATRMNDQWLIGI